IQSVGLRNCDHPQLQGLKTVSAELCAGCHYRETSSSDLESDCGRVESKYSDQAPMSHRHIPLWDCAHLDPADSSKSFRVSDELSQLGSHLNAAPVTHWLPATDQQSWLDVVHPCQHPDYGQSTRRQCDSCPNYLFPQLSPRMTVQDARRLLLTRRGPQPSHSWRWLNVQEAFRKLSDDSIRESSDYPAGFQGRGIVIAGGGRYFPAAYVTIRVLRHVGCRLPIQLWHLAGEMDAETRSVLEPWNVTCIDAGEACHRQQSRFHESWWKGWQLKPFAILNAPFEEVLYLDADSYPTRNPEFLFDWSGYRRLGAVFWPDIDGSAGLLPPDRPPIFGVPSFRDRPTESGQLMINKRDCWRELNLAWFYNAHPEFTYRALWGDKDTFPIAWKRLGRDYARMWPTANSNPQAVLQFDDAGCVLFQHRATDKFRISGTRFDSTHQRLDENQYNPDLIHEDFCFAALAELRESLKL
ncbi:MAG: hypothetical protein JWM11_5506, partial [Planctomycetaceae bacterium]|nr:hypothetical protein [Planctomycetaceae bacterium]